MFVYCRFSPFTANLISSYHVPPTALDTEKVLKMEDHAFLPLFSLQDLPCSYIQNVDQREFFCRHYLAHFWSQRWNIFWLPSSLECKIAGIMGPLFLVTKRQAIEVMAHFEIALPEGVFNQAIMSIERMLVRFPSLTRIEPKYLGNFQRRGYISYLHILKSIDHRSSVADDLDMRQMCANRWLDVHQVYDDIRDILHIDDQRRKEEIHWSSVRVNGELRNMNILSQALTWFGLSLVPPPPFTSMDYLFNYTDWNQHLSPPALTNPILVSLECKWKGTNLLVLTEVGISTLDTRDLFDLPPGCDGASWRALIQSHLLRVVEHEGHNAFQWGRIQIVEECKIGEAIDKILDFPDRNMIFVGRDRGPINMAREAGSVRVRCFKPKVGPCPPFFKVLELFNILCRKNSIWGLGESLEDMGERPEHLNDMGNCSRWVMHLLIRIIIEAAKWREDTRNGLLHPGNMQCDLWGNRLTHPMSRPVVRLPRS